MISSLLVNEEATDTHQVPVDDTDEKSTANDVSQCSWDHALPDVVSNGQAWRVVKDS